MRARVLVTVLGIALIGAGLTAFVAANQDASDSPKPGVTHVPPTRPLELGTPATPSDNRPPTACGDWTDPTEGAVGSRIFEKYGELRTCQLVGTTWVIVTLGFMRADPPISGVIAIYGCGVEDALCLDGRNDHPLSNWIFVNPPYVGSVSVLRIVDDHTLFLGVGDHPLYFDVASTTFTDVQAE